MVRYPINEIQEGMVLGESIYQNERLLIAAGFRLNRQHIEQLKSKGYSSLLIHVPGTEEVIPESIINQQVENELRVTVNKSSKNIQEIIDRGTKEKHHIQDIIKRDKKYLNHIIQNSGAVEIISKMIEDITSEPWTIVNITKMQEASDSLFRHSVNVTIVSLCIGHKYHLPQEELK